MHHADPLGAHQTCRVGMMLKCNTGDLLTKAVFVHHDDAGYTALKHYAGLEWLKSETTNHIPPGCCQGEGIYINPSSYTYMKIGLTHLN